MLKKQREASPQNKVQNQTKKQNERGQSINIPSLISKDDENKFESSIKKNQYIANKSNDIRFFISH